ncbi:hypothetical protein H6G54_26580 [Anabaena cylindrica FACHB-243]|uniref:Uncharacterized protein n=1 Tax=Anabaena cylindrica (strain ATCC 27899 / PCC 7122) TaxID=272123 RepID=K9ZFI5_ANACC|nr:MULTISPECIES: hypothetical protein [Anabaena]AFZ57504.1 hypothetical protein Anacy_2023 [Anabaena cylindrica PCC 7122]MBD2421188.1 hypothetical protein [Anabaena cylindrica FACHB-243]MBY5281714.1 hypothetical protein [Anabaena sp. CCAP 1446/1C]MCM2405946.1 hypothetical protein [Anabaena sp. CCAP 1446/1C]BAY05502.1 hypothetical protein NIES19_47750 [Anabaena cylindrica PCC 7122]
MSDSIHSQRMSCQSICKDCAFFMQMECTHPDEFEINCVAVVFCNSFTPSVEIDSPCVTFGNDD